MKLDEEDIKTVAKAVVKELRKEMWAAVIIIAALIWLERHWPF